MSTHPSVRLDLVTRLSRSRLGPYRTACGGQLDPALDLYVWNSQISSAFFESLHYLEIGLRNAMHDGLTRWAAKAHPSPDPWYINPGVPLSKNAQNKVNVARKRATDGGRAELPGRVIAELSFGFWWSLLAAEYNRTLWQNCLRQVFKNGTKRGTLHDDLDRLLKLRNRAAHHEPLHTRDLGQDYHKLIGVAERISMRYAWFIDSTSRVPGLLTERPPTSP